MRECEVRYSYLVERMNGDLRKLDRDMQATYVINHFVKFWDIPEKR